MIYFFVLYSIFILIFNRTINVINGKDTINMINAINEQRKRTNQIINLWIYEFMKLHITNDQIKRLTKRYKIYDMIYFFVLYSIFILIFNRTINDTINMINTINERDQRIRSTNKSMWLIQSTNTINTINERDQRTNQRIRSMWLMQSTNKSNYKFINLWIYEVTYNERSD
jgi:hypothetical protein